MRNIDRVTICLLVVSTGLHHQPFWTLRGFAASIFGLLLALLWAGVWVYFAKASKPASTMEGE